MQRPPRLDDFGFDSFGIRQEVHAPSRRAR
jgi:hypothetical protein